MLRPLPIVLFCLCTVDAQPASSQESRSGGPVMISAKIGGKSYETAAQGSCRHTPTASIYEVPAALWMVGLTGSEDTGIKSLNLTLWKPKDGTPQQFDEIQGVGLEYAERYVRREHWRGFEPGRQ